MFKMVISFVLIFVTINSSFCQITSVNYLVEYDFSYKKTTGEWSDGEKFLLIGNTNESIYINYNRFRNDSLTFQNLGEFDHNASKVFRQAFINNSLKLPKYEVNQDLRVWKRFNEKEVFCVRQEGYFMVSKENENLMWEISEEKKNINGMVCLKATTNFGGRDFIAWFNPEIPINDGPYKFNNLPGLIVYLTDSQQQYKFELMGLRDPVAVYLNKKSMIPNQNYYMSRGEMVSMLKKTIQNPENYLLFKHDEQTTLRYIERMKKRVDLLIEIE